MHDGLIDVLLFYDYMHEDIGVMLYMSIEMLIKICDGVADAEIIGTSIFIQDVWWILGDNWGY